jgi:phosphate transport system permease protein
VTSSGGSAGTAPVKPPGQSVRPVTLTRRLADIVRASEEGAWRWSALVAVILPLAALVFAVTVLAIKAFPAIKVNGFGFLTGSVWGGKGGAYAATVRTDGVLHPAGVEYGAWPIIAGTIQSSVIAVIFAVPVSIGAAFALTERLPGWVSRPLGFAIELLAGIPSVVIGLWGLLTAGIVLGLMIVPIIASTTRDLFSQVPTLPKEGASALGMTDWEVAQKVTLPWVRSGIIGATVLGLGRALGETIAMVLVGGSALRLAPNIYQPFGTIAATILSQLDGAMVDGTGFAVATLAELALVLAVISVGVNLVARLIITRSSRLSAPVGRGA